MERSFAVGAAPMIDRARIQMTPQGFKWIFNATSGTKYSIEASEDLILWHEVQSLTASGDEVEYLDGTASRSALRFYRVRALP